MIGSKAQLVAVFLLIFPFPLEIISQTARCSKAAFEKVDYEASRVKSWDELYRSYLRYSGCDDGSVAEGYSDSVVRLLAHRWSTFPQVVPLLASDAGFHKFVLRHIDATAGDDDLKAARANAIRSCPAGANEYCVQIRKAEERALRENGTPLLQK